MYLNDRKMYLVLTICVVLVMLSFWWIKTEDKSATEAKEMPQEEAVFPEDGFPHLPTLKKEKEKAIVLKSFNPNTATKEELLGLGLPTYCVNNLLKYRKAGGVWKSKAHFQKLYGLTSEDFLRLSPYILLPKEQPVNVAKVKQRDTTSFQAFFKQPKLKEGETIILNEADTSSLKTIPGIGSYYAKKIVRYRERLGGFVSLEQLKEIENLPEGIEKWIVLDKAPLKTLAINKADFKTLLRHPYLSLEQVRDIFDYRNTMGNIKDKEQLYLFSSFTTDEIDRLLPYLSFE